MREPLKNKTTQECNTHALVLSKLRARPVLPAHTHTHTPMLERHRNICTAAEFLVRDHEDGLNWDSVYVRYHCVRKLYFARHIM